MKPADIPAVHQILLHDFQNNPAPIIDLMAAQNSDPFHILVATLLSARTRDQTTAQVIQNQLFPVVHNLYDLAQLSLEEIEKLIFPVGFYHQKAKALKALPAVVQAKYNGIIPDTVEALCELPGVGRKTANLVVALAFQKPAICVDVHVHRIMNRLGLIQTSTPLETEMALRDILPVAFWTTWNACFVSHGQRCCTPRNPHCTACPIRTYCASTPPNAAPAHPKSV